MASNRDVDAVVEVIESGRYDDVRRGVNANPMLVFERSSLGDTLLHEACRQKQLTIVVLLLDRAADVNAIGDHGFTPLHCAVYEGDSHSVPIVKLLLSRGADPRIRDRRGALPSELAEIECASEYIGELVRLLESAAGRRTFEHIDGDALHAAMARLLGCEQWELPASTPLAEIRRRLVDRYLDVFIFAQVSAALEAMRRTPLPIPQHLPPSMNPFVSDPQDGESRRGFLTVGEWCERVARVFDGLAAVE